MNNNIKYRRDIDALRAFAVLPVIFFHLGYIKNGFLGVDVFFVISGFLITGIIYNQLKAGKFSLKNFYLRRLRRIFPLVFFINILLLIIGFYTMLPEDLERLGRSVVATNLFSNNILEFLTTKDYWSPVNDYKPLIHTWSLAVEEQYYLFYPLLLILFIGVFKLKKWTIATVLAIISLFSFYSFATASNSFAAFFLTPYRLFELLLGGIAFIGLNEKLFEIKYKIFILLALTLVLVIDLPIDQSLLYLITIGLTAWFIVTSDDTVVFKTLVENKLFVGIGLISFSLYMWHQPVLAFTRYIFVETITPGLAFLLFVLIFGLSILSYHFIEQPFRSQQRVKTPKLLITLGVAFLLINSVAFYFFQHSGIFKDIPSLGIKKTDTEAKTNMFYNNRVSAFKKHFKEENKTNVIVIGNSYARDWTNVLLESKYADDLQIYYTYEPEEDLEVIRSLLPKADFVFFSEISVDSARTIVNSDRFDHIYNVGVKNFGKHNGIYFNKNWNSADFCKQQAVVDSSYINSDHRLKVDWKENYISYFDEILLKDNKVNIFTPDCYFISFDGNHLTKYGAQYLAQKLDKKLELLFDKTEVKVENQ